jgi:plasmid stability protein
MPSITVKNIPPELYGRLKQHAEANRRSMNSEIIACIEQVVTSRLIEPEKFLFKARQLREETQDYLISDDEFNLAKQAGRL